MFQKNWKNNLAVTRYIMDSILLIGFILLCLPKVTGVVLHEWLSLLFIVPFVIHLLLHWDWITSLPSSLISNFKAVKGQVRFNILWDFIFYPCFTKKYKIFLDFINDCNLLAIKQRKIYMLELGRTYQY